MTLAAKKAANADSWLLRRTDKPTRVAIALQGALSACERGAARADPAVCAPREPAAP